MTTYNVMIRLYAYYHAHALILTNRKGAYAPSPYPARERHGEAGRPATCNGDWQLNFFSAATLASREILIWKKY